MSYDGASIIKATDATYASGMIALDVSSQPITYDNIVVTSAEAASGASLTSSSTSLAFSANYLAANPSPQTVQIGASGTGSLAWTAVSTVPWLNVSASTAPPRPAHSSLDFEFHAFRRLLHRRHPRDLARSSEQPENHQRQPECRAAGIGHRCSPIQHEFCRHKWNESWSSERFDHRFNWNRTLCVDRNNQRRMVAYFFGIR